jgi:hypothetical protein
MPNKYIKLFINENDFGNIVESIYKQKEMIEKNTGKSCRPFLSNNKFKPREDIVLKADQTYAITVWWNEKDDKKDCTISIKEVDSDEIPRTYKNKDELDFSNIKDNIPF